VGGGELETLYRYFTPFSLFAKTT
jgi:hypothetical protein